MSETANHNSSLRPALTDAIDIARQRIASPGTWLSGATRVAIAAQTRHAKHCSLCQARKDALSPNMVRGAHDHAADLAPVIVEVVHRLVTDSGRLSEKWLGDQLGDALTEEEYVEIIGVVATQVALDTLSHALGEPPMPVLDARAGQPGRRRPSGARKDLAWVSTLSAETISDDDPPFFARHGKVNIHRAISLVPQEAINFFDLDVELYLKDSEIRDFENEYRTISHAQIELVAARASFLNRCYYWTTSHARLLRVSSDVTETDYDLRAITDGESVITSVPHGELLVRFVDAVLGDDPATLAQVRQQVRDTIGEAAFCDTAATVASFNAVVKLADGTGIPLEDYKHKATVDLRADLGIDVLLRPTEG